MTLQKVDPFLQRMETKDPNTSLFVPLNTEPDQIKELALVLQENMENESLTERDLDRITVPTGGARYWVLPAKDEDDEERPVGSLYGIILQTTPPRAYYEKSMNEAGKNPPTCYSPDGATGIGVPGGDCLTCDFNKPKTDPNGKGGKACKEYRMVYMLLPDRPLPAVLQLPRTSIRPYRDYSLRTGKKGVSIYRSYTKFELEKIEGDPDYSRVVISNMGKLTDNDLIRLNRYTNSFRETLTELSKSEATARRMLYGSMDNEADDQADDQADNLNQLPAGNNLVDSPFQPPATSQEADVFFALPDNSDPFAPPDDDDLFAPQERRQTVLTQDREPVTETQVIRNQAAATETCQEEDKPADPMPEEPEEMNSEAHITSLFS